MPDCLLNGTIRVTRTYRKVRISDERRFMPIDFCSPDDVRSLFACENDMTVADLLRRIFKHSRDDKFKFGDPHTDSSEWKLYNKRQEKGSHAVWKMFNNNFRVLDIPTYILEEQDGLVISTLPEHTRRHEMIHPGDVTRAYLVESVHKSSLQVTRYHYDEMQDEIVRQNMYNTNISTNDKEHLSIVRHNKSMLDHLKRKYAESLSLHCRHIQLERNVQ